ncbi:MAG: isocitrate/isopropylmalate family dehydrogenase, partial [Gammaproteobacteria bacterium]|nr:isocitrate/isopropylmalate family dehydrogenase [Gammaproteobacteria bacterium]
MSAKVLVLPGDGIGPEIVAEAVKALNELRANGEVDLELEHADIGGAAY